MFQEEELSSYFTAVEKDVCITYISCLLLWCFLFKTYNYEFMPIRNENLEICLYYPMFVMHMIFVLS